MCPLWPFHYILVYLLLLCPLWFVTCKVGDKTSLWRVSFNPPALNKLEMGQTQEITFSTSDWLPEEKASGIISYHVTDEGIASVPEGVSKEVPIRTDFIPSSAPWSSAFNLTGNFLGYTSVRLRISSRTNNGTALVRESQELKVTVVRKPRVVDKLFTSSVILLVSIIFVNFGCALDVSSLKRAILRPIGPVIGLISHFLFLPLISYGLGLLLFPDSTALRLGLFFTGISPAGGASNIWTYALGGNLNLSITMTAVSTLASFAMIPLWAFTLGQSIFNSGSINVPYIQILTSALGLIIPLSIGYLLQVFCKRLSAVMVRVLKPFSSCLILFIVIFAIVTNLYLFKLFTWQIVVAGIGLPFLGYLSGWLLSTLLGQSPEDVLAIAVETGIQNTGIAIFLLKFCLGQPEADLTTVAPVSVALMTPLPLLGLYLYRRFTRSDSSKITVTKREPTLNGRPTCAIGEDMSPCLLSVSSKCGSLDLEGPTMFGPHPFINNNSVTRH